MERDIDMMSGDSRASWEESSLLNHKELSYDVKLTLVRVCTLIQQMPFSEESYDLLRSITSEAKRFICRTKASSAIHNGNQSINPVTQHGSRNHQQPPTFQEPTKFINASFRAPNNSLLRNSSFKPVTKAVDNPSFGYAPIPADTTIIESIAEDEEDLEVDEEYSDAESLGEETVYLLKTWSVVKVNNNLLLTGVKLDRKGNLLEKPFVSKKIICRTRDMLVRTQCGHFKLDEPISDNTNSIPLQVKDVFLKDTVHHFPKSWRKALEIWIEIEQTAEKEKKKSQKKNNSLVGKPRKSSSNGDKSMNRSSSNNNKSTGDMRRKKTPTYKKKLESQPKSASKKKTSPPAQPKVKEIQKPQKKNEVTKPAKQQRKTKAEVVVPPKKKKKIEKSTVKEGKAAEKEEKAAENEEKASEKEEKGIKRKKKMSNDGVFTDSSGDEEELADLGDDSMFQIPTTSLTPTGLLSSIKKTTIKGRFTPPTSVFDNIYTKSTTPGSNSSVLDDSFDLITRNTNVVKRMAKAKLAPIEAKSSHKSGLPKPDPKVSQKPGLPCLDEESSKMIDEVIAAVTTKSHETPEIVKQVFRRKEYNDDDDDEEFDEDF